MKRIIPRTICIVLFLAAPAVRAELLLDEAFGLPDGPLVGVVGGDWTTHSGTSGQIPVEGGRIRLSGARTEDVRRAFTSNGISAGVLYAALEVRFRALPSPTGAYFFHFKDPADSGAASVFTGRIHASTAGAGAGALRLGASWGTGAPVWVPGDVPTNTWAKLVLRLDFKATEAALWIDPADEGDLRRAAIASDARGVGQGLSQAAFRQATGLGELEVDSLRVGTGFGDVVGRATPRVAIERDASGTRVGMPSWAWREGWRLEVAGTLRGPWTQGPEMWDEGDRAWMSVPEGQPSLWFRLVRR